MAEPESKQLSGSAILFYISDYNSGNSISVRSNSASFAVKALSLPMTQ
jgi:hypothetical protein